MSEEKNIESLSTEKRVFNPPMEGRQNACVKSMAEYSRDPALLYRYRNRLGELIDRAAMPDADPWGESFGVRGFRGR